MRSINQALNIQLSNIDLLQAVTEHQPSKSNDSNNIWAKPAATHPKCVSQDLILWAVSTRWVYSVHQCHGRHQPPDTNQHSTIKDAMINTKHLSIIQWHRDTVSDNLLISTIQLQQLSINIFTFREESGPINLSRKTSDAITTPSSTLASLLVTSSLGWSSSVLVIIVRAENLSQCCITQLCLETGNFNV